MRSFLLGFGVLALIAAAGATLLVRYLARRDTRMVAWPTVSGQVLAADLAKVSVTRVTRIGQGQPTATAPDREEALVWAVRVQYRYQVDGAEYQGDRLTSRSVDEDVTGPQSAPSRLLRDMAQRVRPGQTVTVHYDPADQSESFLFAVSDPAIPKVERASLTLLLAGLSLLAASFLLPLGRRHS